MKNILIFLVVITVAVFGSGCTDKKASKAQALLLEAISYSDGQPSVAGQQAALKFAESKGFKPGDGISGISEREVVMVAGRELCKTILAEYPDTPAAIKAAELRTQIDQKLRTLGNLRIRSLFRDNDE